MRCQRCTFNSLSIAQSFSLRSLSRFHRLLSIPIQNEPYQIHFQSLSRINSAATTLHSFNPIKRIPRATVFNPYQGDNQIQCTFNSYQGRSLIELDFQPLSKVNSFSAWSCTVFSIPIKNRIPLGFQSLSRIIPIARRVSTAGAAGGLSIPIRNQFPSLSSDRRTGRREGQAFSSYQKSTPIASPEVRNDDAIFTFQSLSEINSHSHASTRHPLQQAPSVDSCAKLVRAVAFWA